MPTQLLFFLLASCDLFSEDVLSCWLLLCDDAGGDQVLWLLVELRLGLLHGLTFVRLLVGVLPGKFASLELWVTLFFAQLFMVMVPSLPTHSLLDLSGL